MNYYYADSQNKAVGPVTLESLQALIQQGVLKGDPMVIPEGGSDWRRLSTCNLTGLGSGPGAAAAPGGGTPPDAEPNQVALAAEKAVGAFKNALAAFKILALNPVAGLTSAFESLGPGHAVGVGITYGLMFSLSLLLAFYREPGMFLGEPPAGFSNFIKYLLLALVPFASLCVANVAARMIFCGKSSFSNDCFVAGAALLPWGVIVLLASVFRPTESYNLVAISIVFAICLSILMLFYGLTRVCKISEKAAALAEPCIIILAAFMWKVISQAMLK